MTSQIKTLLFLALLSGLIIVMGGLIGGRGGLIVAFGFALLMNMGSYWFSDRIVLSMYSARELTPQDAPVIHRIVEELATNAGIPKPRLCVVPEQAPNAFATGRNPDHGVVAVTDGILRLLSPEELRGVLAHEIAHIARRDILIQSVAAVLASAITFLAQMAYFFGGGRSREGARPAALLMTMLAPLAAALIRMAISRSREYLADQGGASYSGAPKDLASALTKLQAWNQQTHMLKENPSTAHMFIVNPLSGGLRGLFATHPPIEERVKRLLAMRSSGQTE